MFPDLMDTQEYFKLETCGTGSAIQRAWREGACVCNSQHPRSLES